MKLPIYYYELDFELKFAKSKLSKTNQYFISTVTEDKLQQHLMNNEDDLNTLLYTSFGKGKNPTKSKELLGIDIKVKSVKQIGETNNVS